VNEFLMTYQPYILFWIVGFIINIFASSYGVYRMHTKFGYFELNERMFDVKWYVKLRILIPFLILYDLPKSLYNLDTSDSLHEFIDKRSK